MKHTTIILYGDEQVRKYLDGIALTNQEISEFTKKYSFNTIEEFNAFMYGIKEAYGWREYCPFEA